MENETTAKSSFNRFAKTLYQVSSDELETFLFNLCLFSLAFYGLRFYVEIAHFRHCIDLS